MIIGACTVELYLPGKKSLKEKRRLLKPLLLRLRKEFNLTTAEVDHHDVWQSTQIALVTVSTDARHAQRLLEQAVHWIENHRPDLSVVDWQIEIF
jgi:uncharacterized protein YlxP (DUF503 family)